MSIILLVGFSAIALWSLVSHRFERQGIAGPAVLAAVGMLIVLVDTQAFSEAINSEAALHAIELILAVLLFVDACEVRNGVFGGEGRVLMRLVLIGLPLSLILVVVFGLQLIPELGLFVLIIIACIIMPTDFAPAAQLLRSPKIPSRVRQILNVESGFNDGLISPVFGMSLAVALALPTLLQVAEGGGELNLSAAAEATLEQNLEEFLAAFLGAGPATLIAIGIGLVIGGIFGWLIRLTLHRNWANASGIRYVMLLIPILTYGIATLPAIEANGFVAAFVAGVTCKVVRTYGTEHSSIPHNELLLVEETGILVSSFVWFLLGAATTSVLLAGFDWRLLVLAVLALTLFRVVPVYLSMLSSTVSWRDRTTIGIVGPRGTATIVFGLIAHNQLPDELSHDVLAVTVLTVVGSIVLHGVVVPLVLRGMPLLPSTTQSQAVPQHQQPPG